MDSRSQEEDIPLAKRRKVLQQKLGMQTNLPTTDVQEEKTVSPDSDYIVILDDSEDDEAVINGSDHRAAATPPSKPSPPPAPLPRTQWLPIPLRPINYNRKKPPVTTEPVATTEDIKEEVEEEVIELSSTTEEGEEDDEDDIDTNNSMRSYDKEMERARRVEQEVILLGHGTDDDEKMKQETLKRPREPSPSQQRPMAAPIPKPKTTSSLPSTNRQIPPVPLGSRLNPSHRPYSTNGNASIPLKRGPGRPPRSTVLDTPYEFSNREAASEYRRKFSGPTNGVGSRRASPAINQSAVDKRAKEILHQMTQATRQEMQKSQVAWNAAAMKWREKNKPSEAELRKRVQEDSARASEAAKKRWQNTPSAHSARAARAEAEAGRNRNGNGGGSGGGSNNNAIDPPPPRPAHDAPELERRAYYRNIAQRKVSNASSFGQVLKLLGVPYDDDPTQIKYSYRIAVRMFHPDSNSKEKVWNTPEEKVQAEEVMKIINERKERDF